jgi:hypothetical protein
MRLTNVVCVVLGLVTDGWYPAMTDDADDADGRFLSFWRTLEPESFWGFGIRGRRQLSTTLDKLAGLFQKKKKKKKKRMEWKGRGGFLLRMNHVMYNVV